MYDELINLLRRCGKQKCKNCEYEHVLGCVTKMNEKAADAIEFLQTYKTAFENIVSLGGWWLVGQDKNLYQMNVPMNWPPKGTKTVKVFPLPKPPKEETE